nr:MAG TPA: hypothetical protein [Caudoviricetes sp.]
MPTHPTRPRHRPEATPGRQSAATTSQCTTHTTTSSPT